MLNSTSFVATVGKGGVSSRTAKSDPSLKMVSCSFAINGKEGTAPTWVSAVAFGTIAEAMEYNLSQGDRVEITGDFSTEVYTNPETGISQLKIKVVVRSFNKTASPKQKTAQAAVAA